MYLLLSTVFSSLALPINLIAGSSVVVLLLAFVGSTYANRAMMVVLCAFVCCAFSPLGNVLLTPLEQRFDAKFPESVDGIIILGGSYDTQIRGYLSTIILEENTQPVAAVAALAKKYPNARIVFSGGGYETPDRMTEADFAKDLFISFGIGSERITTERQSRNTVENARFTAALLRPTPNSVWLLVTSAHHMPRAMGTFRKAGFNVEAFPVGWRTHGWGDFWRPALSVTENLRRIDVASHEWFGLTIYSLLGYTTAWFPGEKPTI